jgi:hypothetical protein
LVLDQASSCRLVDTENQSERREWARVSLPVEETTSDFDRFLHREKGLPHP